jgi:hypothetical protein
MELKIQPYHWSTCFDVGLVRTEENSILTETWSVLNDSLDRDRRLVKDSLLIFEFVYWSEFIDTCVLLLSFSLLCTPFIIIYFFI